jgi:holo-[acyl-carrier protein] synthase
MILGVGTDIVKFDRVAALYNKYSKIFIKKTLTLDEQEVLAKLKLTKQKIAYLAKRFAIKEAFVKALGTGFRDDITLVNISIINNNLGKPEIKISKKLLKYLQEHQIFPDNKDNTLPSFHVSVADEQDYIVAFIVIEY